MDQQTKTQASVDRFYRNHGPCCAGCDWWRHVGPIVGECLRSAPVPGDQRIAMLGLESPSMGIEAGHVMTLRGHHCGEFKDEFDWGTLPPHYLRHIERA